MRERRKKEGRNNKGERTEEDVDEVLGKDVEFRVVDVVTEAAR